MSPHFAMALVLAALWASLAGCGPLKPSTPEMFYGNCIMVPGRDLCGADREICQAYQTVTTDEHPSAQACREACNAASAKLGMQYLLDNCDYTRMRGNNLCEQQCLRLYPVAGQ
jgi:hypothetical protein